VTARPRATSLRGAIRRLPRSSYKIGSTFEKLSVISRDGGIRTRGLLLPNQLHPAARRSPAAPSVAFTWNNIGLTLPDVAR
jgi:hypothetical protein